MGVALLAGAVAFAGCGSDGSSGPPVVTGQALGDALAVAAKDDLENRGVFNTTVGDQGGYCRGGAARWECSLEIEVSSTSSIRDRRVYDMRVGQDGCWVARQTGTDVGQTGTVRPPTRPQVLRGCLK